MRIATFCVIAILVLFAAPAHSEDQAWQDCVQGVDQDREIVGCTKFLARGASESQENRAIAYASRGDAYVSKRDYDRAIADYDEAIRLNPRYVAGYGGRGEAFSGKGDYDRAFRDFDEAIRLNPKAAVAYNSRGVAYSRKGDYEHAIREFDESIRYFPKSAYPNEAYYNRGVANSAKGDHARAIRDFDEAIRQATLAANDQLLQNARAARDVAKQALAAAQAKPQSSVDAPPPSASLAGPLSESRVAVEIVPAAGHSSSVVSVAFSTDGRWVASQGDYGDMSVNLWEVASGKLVRTFKHPGGLSIIQFSRDNRRLIMRSGDDVGMRDIETGASSHSVDTGVGIGAISVSPSERQLAFEKAEKADSAGKRLSLLDLDSRKRVWTAGDSAHGIFEISKIEFSPDARMVATTSMDTSFRVPTLKLWDARTGQRLHSLAENSFQTSAIAFSPDSRLIAAAVSGRDYKFAIYVWNTAGGALVQTFGATAYHPSIF